MDLKLSKKKEIESSGFEEATKLNGESDSYIGKSVKIKGNISSQGSILIDGKVKGNIKVSGNITIGQDGNVNGKLEAGTIDIKGKAKGEIITTQKLNLHSTANFEGNITSKNVVITEGGVFNGNMNMTGKKQE